MKAVKGKIAAVFVAATIGATGLFAPTTARASHELLNVQEFRNFIDANTDTSFIFIKYLAYRFFVELNFALNQHLYNAAVARGGGSDRSSLDGRSYASQEFGRGMAAGSLFGLGEDVSVWASGSHTSSENDFVGTAFESDTNSASFGADIRVDEIATLGAFLSFSNTDTTSSFNNGGSETDSVSFGPYVSAVVNDNVSVDASFGFLFMESDNKRNPAGAAAAITGGQTGTGIFGSANLNYSRWMDALNLNGRVGVTASNVRNKGYVDSTATLVRGSSSSSAQFQFEAQASYYFDNFAPFARVMYQVEASPDIATAAGTPQPANDKDEFVIAGGVNLFGFGPVTGGINYSRTLAHSDFDSWTVSGQISIALGGN